VKIGSVFRFPNGMIAVCDEHGEQVPDLQGRDTPELRAKIDPLITDATELHGYVATARTNKT
jgi:hypothetical protein